MKTKVNIKKPLVLFFLYIVICGCVNKNSKTQVAQEGQNTPTDTCRVRYMPLNERDSGLYNMILNAKDHELPLGGSYEGGMSLFEKSDGKTDATTVFYSVGPSYLLRTSTAIIPGFDDLEISMRILKNKSNKFVKIPDSGDVVNVKKERYLKAAMVYATNFNTQMFELTTNCHLNIQY